MTCKDYTVVKKSADASDRDAATPGGSDSEHPARNPRKGPDERLDPGLVDEIAHSAAELHSRAERHQALVSRLCRDAGSVGIHGEREGSSRALVKDTLVDAIEILEGTRRAFKSKQLEVLRRRLTRVLVELD